MSTRSPIDNKAGRGAEPGRDPVKTSQGTRSRAGTAAMCAVLTALALIFSYIEFLLPLSLGIPGVKLGLANLVIVVSLYMAGARYALLVNIARVLLVGLLFGNTFSALYAMAGALVSFAAMYLIKKTGLFSPAGTSIAGGVFHNVGQLAVAALITENVKIALYFPVLLISGLLTGLVIGALSVLILRALRGGSAPAQGK